IIPFDKYTTTCRRIKLRTLFVLEIAWLRRGLRVPFSDIPQRRITRWRNDLHGIRSYRVVLGHAGVHHPIGHGRVSPIAAKCRQRNPLRSIDGAMILHDRHHGYADELIRRYLPRGVDEPRGDRVRAVRHLARVPHPCEGGTDDVPAASWSVIDQ